MQRGNVPVNDLFAPDTVAALRRIGEVASRGSRHAAWALDTFEDERTATAALVDGERVDSARRSLEHVRADPASAILIPRWEAKVARLEGLFARRPTKPPIPDDMAAWTHARLGLEPDVDRATTNACTFGRHSTFVGVAKSWPVADPVRLADALAFAYDVFPLGERWEVTTRADMEVDLTHAISTDLAYETVLVPRERARELARGFLDLFGDDPVVLTNSSALDPARRQFSGRWSNPLTLATFDWGIAVIGEQRIGIAVLTGED